MQGNQKKNNNIINRCADAMKDWQTYIFRLILLLAQVVFREKVLTLSVDVSVGTLK